MTQAKLFPYVVSACLAGLACRYDGGSNACGVVVALVRAGLAVPACPETLGGLPVPREPCEQRAGRVVGRDGVDRTEAFLRGSRKALAVALAHGCRAAILKSRSPSCGCGRIYDGTFTRTLIPGMGTWARLLQEAGLELYTEENLPPLE